MIRDVVSIPKGVTTTSLTTFRMEDASADL